MVMSGLAAEQNGTELLVNCLQFEMSECLNCECGGSNLLRN